MQKKRKLKNAICKADILNQVCKEFNLGSLKRATALEEGFSSFYCKFVTNKSKYFVKAYTMDKLKTVTSAAKAELFFQKGGIPVLMRMNTLDGSNYLILDNKIFVVFPYITIPKIKKWGKELYYEFGDFLGRMHKYSTRAISKRGCKTFNLGEAKMLSLKSMRLLLDAFHKKEQIDENDKLAIYNLMEKIKGLKNISCEKFALDNKTIIHGDFHPNNLCIKDNKIRMICDFDNYCLGSIYYELTKVIINTCFSGSFDNKKFIRTRKFLSGYQKHIQITPSTLRRAIKICHFEVFSSSWAEKKYLENPSDKLLEILKKEKRMIDYFANINLDDFTERICGFLNIK